MPTVTLNGPTLGDSLQALLSAPDIEPGDKPSYELCKKIYTAHPLGAKLAEKPIQLAQSKPRVVTVAKAPEERVAKAFLDQWERDGADKHLANLHRLKRVYGVAAIALLTEGKAPDTEIDYEKLWKDTIAFNVYDPLNVAGSLTGNLQPNSPGFLKTQGIAVNGVPYHRSRSCIALNEEPIYLEWTASAFGYVGRSVYQRSLYPLKSFLETMRTDALVARKAGVLVAMMKQAGSIIDNVMDSLFARKRQVVKDAETGNVIGIGCEEKIESLNLQNVNGAMKESRSNILENIAAGSGMPAILVTQETFSAEFHEGDQDAAAVADYIKHEQEEMKPSYDWMDNIIQHRAWNPEFYTTIQADFPEEYGGVDYKTAYYRWVNSFSAPWPSLLTEPESETVRVEEVKLKALIAAVQVAAPAFGPINKANLFMWFADELNEHSGLFSTPLLLDAEELETYEPPIGESEPKPAHPFAAQDSAHGSEYSLSSFKRPKVVAIKKEA